MIVVEATGIRDVPSGPLLRIGHDRFLEGLSRLVETVRVASGGATRLFLQVIDFLSIRRRPTPEAYLGRFLAVTDALRGRMARALAEPEWAAGPESDLRARLLRCSRPELEAVLDERELEALDVGARERVTDVHLPHVRDLPRVLPGLFADAADRARARGLRRDRAPLRARLHDGVVPLAAEHARPTATGRRSKGGCACRSR